MSRILKVALVAVAGLLPFHPVSAQSPAKSHGEEARLWIATNERLLGLRLDSGLVSHEVPIAEAVRSLAVDSSARSLWVLRDQRLDRLDLLDPDQLESVASIPVQASGGAPTLAPTAGGIVVVSEVRVEEFSETGRLVESRAAHVSTDQRRLFEGTDCVEPIDGDRLRTSSRSVQWIHQDGDLSSPELEFRAARFTQCDPFGGAWVASTTRVARVNRLGELAVDLTIPPEFGEIRAMRSDSRDGALWLATRQRLFRLGLDGLVQERFQAEGDEEIHALAFELVGGEAAPQKRATPRKLGLQRGLRAAPGSNLGPGEIAFQGRAVSPDGRPIAGMEVVVFADAVVRTTTAADGTFLTPGVAHASMASNILVTLQKTTAAGRIYTSAQFGIAADQTWDMGDVYADYFCPVDFAAGDFPANALNGDVRSMVVFDNGTGAALYVAGTFTTAGGVTVNRVAKWNGTSWSALGSGLGGGTTPTVDSLVVFDDGSGARLYAGGNFTTSGATSVKYVAKWTGSAWTQVGLGLAAQVYALAVFNDGTGAKLYAGGSFTSANSVTYNRLAKWSGSAWQAVSSGLNGEVRSLAVHNDGSGSKLYVGGLFTQAGGSVTANRIARWSGSAWSAVGTGVAGGSPIQVNAMLSWDDGTGAKLYAGGRFTTAGGTTVNHIARWNGASWSALAIGLGTQVNALASFDDGYGPALFAAGSFTTVSGTAYNRLARWDGSTWSAIGDGLNGAALADTPGSIPGKESSLYVGGSFASANGVTSTRVARLRRPTTCSDGYYPDLAFVTPLEGSAQGSSTPQLTFGFGDYGSGVQSGTIEIQQNGATLSTSCTYAADTATCALLQPVSGGAVTLSATIRDLAGNTSLPATRSFVVQDLAAPVLAFTEPLEGAIAASARPALRFAYSDVGSGIDTASLAVLANGASVAVECQFGGSTALCVPLADLPAGAVVLSATIRDVQSNVSLPASVHLSVPAVVAYSVTLTGTTRFEDGSPAAGARVSFLSSFSPTATSGADGAFSIGPITLTRLIPLDLAASVTLAAKPYVGYANDFLPPASGVHSVGIVTLKKRCDSFATSLPWTASEAAIPVDVLFLSTPQHVAAMAAWDSGSGSELYVGGQFNYTPQGTRSQVARWGVAGWQQLGAGLDHSSQPSVSSFAVFDDGTGPALYSGGRFTIAGSEWADYLAKWDGSRWSEVGRGVNARVKALAVFDDGTGPALYVAGDFSAVGSSTDWTGTDRSVAANRVAKWNGEDWEEVAGGFSTEALNGYVRMEVLADLEGTSLFLWGSGVPVLRLRNNVWEPLDSGDYSTGDLVAFDDGSGAALFRSYAGASGSYLQKRVAGAWINVTPLTADEHHLVVHSSVDGTFLYAADAFSGLPGSPPGVHIRRWNGTSWSAPLGVADALFEVPDLAGPAKLHAVVERSNPGEDTVLTWNGAAFVPLLPSSNSTGSVDSVAVLEETSGSSIFFSGLDRAGGVSLGGGIGRWDGTAVSPAGQGLENGGTKVFRGFDGTAWDVYAIAGPEGRVAKWNGSSWTTIGEPIGVQIHTLAWLDLGTGVHLYAAGDGVFRWNGVFWASLNGPNDVNALEAFGGKLFAGGGYLVEGYPSVGILKEWDGANWSDVGPAGSKGVNGPVYALRTLAGRLHIGGAFDHAGTANFVGYVAWNGYSWDGGVSEGCGYFKNRFLGEVGTTPIDGVVYALEVLDDGRSATSPQLIVGGDYASYCASVSGSNFSGGEYPFFNVNLGLGADAPPVRALSTGTFFGAPGMVVGGAFGEFDGQPSAKLAIWGTTPSWSGCSTADQPPVITVTSPTSLVTPSANVIFAGSIDEPATLTLNGVDLTVTAARTFASAPVGLHEGLNSFVLEAIDRDALTSRAQIDLLRDSIAPSVAVVFPGQGAVVTSAQPAVDLEFQDSGAGVDTATLYVELNGVPLPGGACVVRPGRARCMPGSPLPAGPNALAVRVRDLAGNLSPTVQRSFAFNVAAGGTGTTLTGTVQRAAGGAATGARVRLLGFSGVDAFAAADGTFTLTVPALRSRNLLTVVAELDDAAGLLLGTANGVAPVTGGTTAVGTIVLGPACDPVFVSGLLDSQVDLSSRILALAVFDEGSGPTLFAAGDNLLSQGGTFFDLVKWSGSKWIPSPLGTVSGTSMGLIRALAVFNDGTGPALYAGGSFTSAGGVPANSLAKWNGTAWSAVGGGMTTSLVSPSTGLCLAPVAGSVYALRSGVDASGPALFVGGDFLTAGGVPADLAARWNGVTWAGAPGPACHSSGRRVEALSIYDDGSGPAIFAGGYFTSIGGVPARSIARFTGTSWTPLAEGIGIRSPQGVVSTGLVSSMAVFDSGDGPELVVGGLFGRAGSGLGLANSLARWNGASWAPLGDGLETVFTSLTEPSGVQSLFVFDDGTGPALFAAGSLTGASQTQFHGIAKWNGSDWLPLGAGLTGTGTGGMSMIPFEGRLVVGGGFSAANGVAARGVARWGSEGWSVFGSNLTGAVASLALFDDGTGAALYAGGTFVTTGSKTLNRIARWSGSAWEPVGAGFNSDVRALAVYSEGGMPKLFAGGAFTASGATAMTGLARWDGSVWSPVGGGVMNGASAGVVEALAVHTDAGGPALFVGGTFTLAGGVSANRVARWNGTAFSALGTGLNNTVYALTPANVGGTSALFAGGSFTTAGGATANRVAKWNGTAWSAVGTGTNNIVYALQAWPPATGTQLLAGGTFTTAGGISASKLARWSGSAWSAATGGSPNNTVEALVARQEGSTNRIVAGGAFTLAGSVAALRLGDWNGTAWKAMGAGAANNSVLALLEQDEPSGRSLWVGGSFTTIGGLDSPAIARWQRPLVCGDTSPPTLTITAPVAGSVLLAATPTLTVTHSDTMSGVDTSTLQWKVNGAPVATTCSSTAGQSNCQLVSPLVDGPASFVASVRDYATNVGTSPAVAVSVDTLPPTVVFTSPANGAILTASPAGIEISYSDSATAIVTSSFLFSGSGPASAQWSCPLDAQAATCIPSAALAEGAWSVTASITDSAGHRGEATIGFTVDTAAPTLAITAPLNGVILNDRTPNLQVTYSDAGSGVDPQTLVWQANGTPFAATCQTNGSGATCEPTADLPLGPVTISATVRDYAQRLSPLAQVAITLSLDFTPPVLIITSPAEGAATPASQVTIAGSLDEAGSLSINGTSATLNAQHEFSFGPVTLAQGWNRFTIVATDLVGNPTQRVLRVIRDDEAPQLAFATPEDGSFFDPLSSQVELLVGDLGSGADPGSIEMFANGGPIAVTCQSCAPWLRCTVPVTPAPVVTLTASIADRAGNRSQTATSRYATTSGADILPPIIQLQSPTSGSRTKEPAVVFVGRLNEAATLTLNGGSVVVQPNLTFVHGPVPLDEGPNSFVLHAQDLAGNVSDLPVTVTLDRLAPPPVVPALVTVGVSAAGSSLVSGAAGASPETGSGFRIRYRNGSTGVVVESAVSGSGSFSALVGAEGGDRISLTVLDDLGNASEPRTLVVPGTPALPPEPATVAPTLDGTVASGLCAQLAFLTDPATNLQRGVAIGAIDCRRVSLLRGRVTDRAGQGIGAVRVSLPGQPEMGLSLTRADGRYDIAVLGGGAVIVHFGMPGRLSAERQIDLAWGETASLEDVLLLEADAASTVITAGPASAAQVARGTTVSDSDGARRATLLFQPGTSATLRFPEGQASAVGSLTVRATEYTVGAAGPKAMPATLPPTSAYTYAVELSADEVEAAGAVALELSQPLPVYLENFLGFPVGTVVPAGYYDFEKHLWIPEKNGAVIKILGITGGAADLDLTGSGLPGTAPELAALGITLAERQSLAGLYVAGQELWRVPVQHFTPHDFNFPWIASGDPQPPRNEAPKGGDSSKKSDPCLNGGSIIECENQVLGEVLPVSGTPITLHYQSDRVRGRKTAFELEIPLSGAAISPDVQRIDLQLDVAGQHLEHSVAPSAGASFDFGWDGKDAYGRELQGRQPYEVSVGYVYGANYGEVPPGCDECFGATGVAPISGNPTRQEVTFWQTHTGRVGVWEARDALRMGGWSLSVQHVYDPHDGILYLGDGSWRKPEGVQVITTVAGTGSWGDSGGDGGPASEATLAEPIAMVREPSGSEGFYFIDQDTCQIRHVTLGGTIRRVAGSVCPDLGEHSLLTEGIAALDAILQWPLGLAVASDGTLYVAEPYAHIVRRIDKSGRIGTVFGWAYQNEGVPGDTPATQVFLESPRSLAIGPDGALYVGTSMQLEGQIYRVDPEAGTWSYVVEGRGWSCSDFLTLGVTAPARTSYLPPDVVSLVFSPEGELFVAARTDTDLGENQFSSILKVRPDGILELVAGRCASGTCGQNNWVCSGFSGEGGPAANALLGKIAGMSLSLNGELFLADSSHHVVQRIDSQGVLSRAAGTGAAGSSPVGTPVRAAMLSSPSDVEVLPGGRLLVSERGSNRIRAFDDIFPEPPSTPSQVILIPSEDGRTRYVFDSYGKHLRTEDAQTGQVLLTFGYDSLGYATSVTDAFANVTTIERNAGHVATAIVAPFGQRTELTYDGNGYLATVENPESEQVQFTYDADGLMQTMTDARGHLTEFTFDAKGRLERDEDPLGGFTALSRDNGGSTYTITKSSAMGRTTTILTEKLPTGETRTTTTAPDGTTSVALKSPSGARTSTSADGTIATAMEVPDPRFGMQAPTLSALTVTSPGGLASTTALSRSVALVNPDGDPADPANVASISDSVTVNGRTATSLYSRAARTLTTTSPLGRQGTTTFDLFGRVSEALSPGVAPVSSAYDAQGRLSTVTQGSRQTLYTYNSQGLLWKIRDPLLREVEFTYDSVGRVLTQKLPDTRIVQFDYDANGNLTALTPPGRPQHGFVYDNADQGTVYDPPAAGLPEDRTLFTYNLDHQLELVTRPDGQTIDSVYDLVTGRLTSMVTPRGSYEYGYQPGSGNLASVADPDGGSLAFTYDGSLPKSVTWTGPVAGSLQLGYNSSFELTSRKINDANEVTFGYDLDGLLTQAGALTLTRSATTGFLSGTTLAGATDLFTYTGFGELDTYTARHGATDLYSFDTTRDNGGRIATKSETVEGVTHAWEYVYDTAGRLDQVKRDSVVVADYDYDANSNRTAWTDGWGSGTAVYDDQDRLLSYGSKTYTYTANGELATKTDGTDVTTYSYDVLGNLRTVVLPTGVTIDYVIDAANRRVGKKVNGTLVQGFLYQSQLAPAAELDGSGNIVSQFVYATKGNVPDYMVKAGATYRLFTDHLGSVRLVVNAATGAIAQRIDYDAFGRIQLDTNPGFQPFGFAGGIYDIQTGLTRFGARDYDAETGRWAAKDPIGFGGGISNLYGYVLGDPVNALDVTGLYAGWDDAAFFVGGALVGAGTQLFSDLIAGEWGGWAALGRATLGGAIGGIATLYFGPVAGGAAGALLTDAMNQDAALKSGTQCRWDFERLALNTAVGGITGRVFSAASVGNGTARGGAGHVFKTTLGRLRNRGIRSIKPSTGLTMARGAFDEYQVGLSSVVGVEAGNLGGELMGGSEESCGCQ